MPNPGLASDAAFPAVLPMADATPLSAADRLAASRTRLRAALMEIAHPPPRPSMFDGLGKLGGFLDLKGPLIDRIKAMPGASLVLETLESWWAQHPLHTAGVVAEEASRNFVLPIARQNPYGLMIGSVVFGALFVLSRPWRWLLRPALFVGLVPQLAVQALKRMPIESWLRVFESIKTPRKPAATTDAPSATDDRPEAPSMP